MAKPGPKPGSTQKLRAPQVAEILQERGVNLVRRLLDNAEALESENRHSEAAKIYATLMQYVYAKRREEDSSGKTADFIAVPVTPEENAKLVKAARGN